MPSPLLRGLRLTLRRPRPLLWLYTFSLAVAWLTTIGFRIQYANVTSASLASQRLIGGFDLGVALDAARRLSDGPAGGLTPSLLTTPIYLLLFFLLTPGTILTYQTDASLRLGILLQTGLQLFWTFVRITLWTALVAGPVLGLLGALRTGLTTLVDRSITGRPAFLIQLTGTLLLLLVAALLRLFFDLVEVHAVHRAQYPLPNGKPDRRTRKSLRPALQTLTPRSYLAFLVLTLFGFAAAFFLTRSALRHLAQPRVWPTVLLVQLSIFLLLFTRLWQRAAETVMVQDLLPVDRRSPIFTPANPLPIAPLEAPMTYQTSSFPTPAPVNPISPILPGPDSNPFPEPSPTPDPLPNPEPISPSLATPDTGVFQHDVSPKKDLLN